jgi:hypothetical protein
VYHRCQRIRDQIFEGGQSQAESFRIARICPEHREFGYQSLVHRMRHPLHLHDRSDPNHQELREVRLLRFPTLRQNQLFLIFQGGLKDLIDTEARKRHRVYLQTESA